MPILSGPTTAASLTWRVMIDWNDDGDYSDAGEDVTERVLARGSLNTEYGRDQSRSLSPVAPGRARFDLNNHSRDYSPDNTSSPLYGLLRPGLPILVQVSYNGVTYTLYTGHIDDYDVQVERNSKSVALSGLDALASLSGVKIFTPLYQGILMGQAVHYILDAAGWPATARDVDRGATVAAWWWEDDADALEALKRVVNSEGPGAIVYTDTDGRLVFRGRHHRYVNAGSLTSQVTLSDGETTGPEPWFSPPFSYDVGWRDIINSVSFSVESRAPEELAPVWSLEGSTISLVDGETRVVSAKASNPFLNAVTPVAGTDYTLIAGSVTVSLSRTSGGSTDVIIKATGGPARLDGLQVRGRSVPVAATYVVNVADQGSINDYGIRSHPDDASWAGRGDAESIGQMILARRAQRLPTVSLHLLGTHPERLNQQLVRDLSDRVHVVEDETGVDDDFYIEQIQHLVTGGGFLSTTFGCERAPSQLTDVFILGSATQGVLGTNRLGSRGFDDPTTMFILGSVTNGVLGESILAT